MHNTIILCGVLAWLVAQIIKTILHAIKINKVVLERVVGAGGMPSSHTAMVVSSLVSVGRMEGLNSAVFGVMFIISAIVIYDAMGVRRAAGLHAKQLNIINRMIIKNKKTKTDESYNIESEKKELKEFLGHTPLEVIGGAIVGIIIAFVVPVKD